MTRAVGTSYRERRVLELRTEGLTFQQIGDLLGITRERVRQIERAARDKAAPAVGPGP